MNQEPWMFKLDLEKAEESEIKLLTSIGSSKKAREFQKNIYFCFIDYAKAFDCVDHNKPWKILQDMESDHLTCLLRNLYAAKKQPLELNMEQTGPTLGEDMYLITSFISFLLTNLLS